MREILQSFVCKSSCRQRLRGCNKNSSNTFFVIALLLASVSHNNNTAHKQSYAAAMPIHSDNTSPSSTKSTSTRSVQEQEYYLDTADGKCKINTPSKPTWINILYSSYQECCDNSWDKYNCLAEFTDNSNEPTNSGGTTDSNTGDEGEAEIILVWYYDISDGLCKLNTADKPSWLDDSQIYTDINICCDVSWDTSLCLSKAERPIANNADGTADTGDADNSIPPKVINLTIYGTLQLQLHSLPTSTSSQWTKLKIALTKTFIQLFNSEWVITDGMEVELWSLNGVSFTTSSRHLIDGQLRGNHNQNHRRLLSSHELQFQLTLPSKCNSNCQSITQQIALGSDTPFKEIYTHFTTFVTTGQFSSTLNKMGTPMGLFSDGSPSVSNGQLTYHYGVYSSTLTSWSPSSQPTEPPTTQSPTMDIHYTDSIVSQTNKYYPDLEQKTCLNDGNEGEHQPNLYDTLDECVSSYRICASS